MDSIKSDIETFPATTDHFFVRIGSFYRSMQIDKIAGALSKAQGLFGVAKKDSQVKIELKSGKEIQYKYSDFCGVVEVTQKPLSENGLAVLQPFKLLKGKEGNLIRMSTIIIHESGQFFQFDTDFPVFDLDPKQVAGVVTYCQRYTYKAALRVVSDVEEDLDQKPEAAPAVKGSAASKEPAKAPAPPAGKEYKHIKTSEAPKRPPTTDAVHQPVDPGPVKEAEQAAEVQAEAKAEPEAKPERTRADWSEPDPVRETPKEAKASAGVPPYIKDLRDYMVTCLPGVVIADELKKGDMALFLQGRKVNDLTEAEIPAFRKIVEKRGGEIFEASLAF